MACLSMVLAGMGLLLVLVLGVDGGQWAQLIYAMDGLVVGGLAPVLSVLAAETAHATALPPITPGVRRRAAAKVMVALAVGALVTRQLLPILCLAVTEDDASVALVVEAALPVVGATLLFAVELVVWGVRTRWPVAAIGGRPDFVVQRLTATDRLMSLAGASVPWACVLAVGYAAPVLFASAWDGASSSSAYSGSGQGCAAATLLVTAGVLLATLPAGLAGNGSPVQAQTRLTGAEAVMGLVLLLLGSIEKRQTMWLGLSGLMVVMTGILHVGVVLVAIESFERQGRCIWVAIAYAAAELAAAGLGLLLPQSTSADSDADLTMATVVAVLAAAVGWAVTTKCTVLRIDDGFGRVMVSPKGTWRGNRVDERSPLNAPTPQRSTSDVASVTAPQPICNVTSRPAVLLRRSFNSTDAKAELDPRQATSRGGRPGTSRSRSKSASGIRRDKSFFRSSKTADTDDVIDATSMPNEKKKWVPDEENPSFKWRDLSTIDLQGASPTNFDAVVAVQSESPLSNAVYAEVNGEVGLTSFHFDEIGLGGWVSFELAPAGWELDNGMRLPSRKHMVDCVWDGHTRTFDGRVNWASEKTTWHGVEVWHYQMGFSEDMTCIDRGTACGYAKYPDKPTYTLKFGRDLNYHLKVPLNRAHSARVAMSRDDSLFWTGQPRRGGRRQVADPRRAVSGPARAGSTSGAGDGDVEMGDGAGRRRSEPTIVAPRRSSVERRGAETEADFLDRVARHALEMASDSASSAYTTDTARSVEPDPPPLTPPRTHRGDETARRRRGRMANGYGDGGGQLTARSGRDRGDKTSRSTRRMRVRRDGWAAEESRRSQARRARPAAHAAHGLRPTSGRKRRNIQQIDVSNGATFM